LTEPVEKLLWKFIDFTPVIEISIENTLLGEVYPSKGRGVMAVLDTGYSGFLYIPKNLFEKLHLSDLKAMKSEAVLADGSSVQLTGAFGSVNYLRVGLKVDGLIETSDDAEEILVGMQGIRGLFLELDCCRERLRAQECSLD
jgi:clan AA aspartic protease